MSLICDVRDTKALVVMMLSYFSITFLYFMGGFFVVVCFMVCVYVCVYVHVYPCVCLDYV